MSWPTAALSDISLFIRNGKSIQQAKDLDGLPITRIETIASQVIDPTRVGYAGLSEQLAEGYLLEPGDILFSHINSLDHLGKCAQYVGHPAKLVHGMNLLNIRPDPAIADCRYVLHALRAPEQRAKFLSIANKSVNQASISAGNLKKVQVPLPPLPEQRRIAAILDKADALRAKRREAIAKLDQLLQSVFLDMFGDPVTNPKGWPRVSLGRTTTKIGSGATPTGGDESYKESGISLIRSLNVHDGDFRWPKLAFIDDKQALKLKNVIVEEDDVLLNITGASVARVCRAPRAVLPARVNQHVSIIRCGPSLSAPYLEHALMSQSMKTKLLSTAESGATRQAITKSDIEQLEVSLPPLPFQARFAAISSHLHAQVETSERALTTCEAMLVSIQDRAFAGTL